MIDKVEVDAGQIPFVIVHMKTLTPKPNPTMFVFGDVGVTINPEPETSVQLPVPTAATLPAMVVLVAQILNDGPALATVGF